MQLCQPPSAQILGFHESFLGSAVASDGVCRPYPSSPSAVLVWQRVTHFSAASGLQGDSTFLEESPLESPSHGTRLGSSWGEGQHSTVPTLLLHAATSCSSPGEGPRSRKQTGKVLSRKSSLNTPAFAQGAS